MSNLISITRIYDIYPKYTYSNDVKKFMDEIVDIDRANVFTEADVVDILEKIRTEIEALPKTYPFINHIDVYVKEDDVKKIIDKHKAERSE